MYSKLTQIPQLLYHEYNRIHHESLAECLWDQLDHGLHFASHTNYLNKKYSETTSVLYTILRWLIFNYGTKVHILKMISLATLSNNARSFKHASRSHIAKLKNVEMHQERGASLLFKMNTHKTNTWRFTSSQYWDHKKFWPARKYTLIRTRNNIITEMSIVRPFLDTKITSPRMPMDDTIPINYLWQLQLRFITPSHVSIHF